MVIEGKRHGYLLRLIIKSYMFGAKIGIADENIAGLIIHSGTATSPRLNFSHGWGRVFFSDLSLRKETRQVERLQASSRAWSIDVVEIRLAPLRSIGPPRFLLTSEIALDPGNGN